VTTVPRRRLFGISATSSTWRTRASSVDCGASPSISTVDDERVTLSPRDGRRQALEVLSSTSNFIQ
jgi:hypothetical protein